MYSGSEAATQSSQPHPRSFWIGAGPVKSPPATTAEVVLLGGEQRFTDLVVAGENRIRFAEFSMRNPRTRYLIIQSPEGPRVKTAGR